MLKIPLDLPTRRANSITWKMQLEGKPGRGTWFNIHAYTDGLQPSLCSEELIKAMGQPETNTIYLRISRTPTEGSQLVWQPCTILVTKSDDQSWGEPDVHFVRYKMNHIYSRNIHGTLTYDTGDVLAKWLGEGRHHLYVAAWECVK